MTEDIKLSVIIPVYNEANTILEVVRLVRQERHKKEIIIVDDGSIDGTRELLEKVGGGDIRVLFSPKNRGKGYSVREGLKHVTGDIVVIQDADLEYYPDEYDHLIENIVKGKADVVYGSRFLGAHRVFYFYHYLGNILLNMIVNILLNTTLTDSMTCYKAFKTSVIKKLALESDGFGIETEITAEVFKRRYRVYEVPIFYNGRTYEEGKKIRWTDFFVCLGWLLRSLFRPLDVGTDALLKMKLMRNNNLWTYDKIRPFLGKKILELGSGIGTVSKYIIEKDREVTLTDINQEYVDYLKERFAGNPRVKIINADACRIDERFVAERFDTVVGVSILEHLDDDAGVIRRLKKVLVPGGRLVLVVPAHKALFGSLDERAGHLRRYSKEELAGRLEKEGFLVEKTEFMDYLGAFGWFLNFKVLRRKRMPKFTMLLFDRLIPLLALSEKYVKLPFGLSLICVARARE